MKTVENKALMRIYRKDLTLPADMGREERERKLERNTFLTRLAQEDPQRFNSEWDFRLGYWLAEITGFRHGMIDAKPVFMTLEKALNILRECGDNAMKLQFKRTYDILSTECVRVVAGHCGGEFYRLNQKYGFLNYNPKNIKENGRR